MRFSEVEQNDKLEWLIRKDGCMHCSDPGCLKACPAEGAIIQYANGIVDFQSEQLHRLRLLHCRAVRSTFRASTRKTTASTNVRCALTASVVGQEPACVKTCPTGAIHFGTKE